MMRKHGQRKSQAKRVRFDLSTVQASMPTAVRNPQPASSKASSSREPDPHAARQSEDPLRNPLTTSQITRTTQITRYWTQPVRGKTQLEYSKLEDTVIAMQRPRAESIKLQFYCSHVDSIVFKMSSCRLDRPGERCYRQS